MISTKKINYIVLVQKDVVLPNPEWGEKDVSSDPTELLGNFGFQPISAYQSN